MKTYSELETEVNDLRSQLDAAMALNEDRIKRIQALNVRLEGAEDTRTALELCKRNHAEKAEKIAALQRQISGQSRKITQQVRDGRAQRIALRDMEEALLQARRAAQQRQTEANRLRSQLRQRDHTARGEASTLRRQIADLEVKMAALRQLRQQSPEAQQSYKRAKEEIARLSAEAGDLRRQIVSREACIKDQGVAIRDERETSDRLRSELSREKFKARAEIEEVIKSKEAAIREIKARRPEEGLEAVEAARQELRRMLERKSEEANALEMENKEIKQDLAQYIDALAKAEKARRDLESKDGELCAIRRTLDGSREEARGLHAQLGKAVADLDESRKEVRALKKMMEDERASWIQMMGDRPDVRKESARKINEVIMEKDAEINRLAMRLEGCRDGRRKTDARANRLQAALDRVMDALKSAEDKG